MTDILTFNATGAFASFRDPSVTSNQSVYYIPSKTAVVGLLGAVLGIKRSNTLDELYSEQYLEFFQNIKIGIGLENNPRKITYFTNYRSLLKSKTKPVKKEMLEAPKYKVYVLAPQKTLDDLLYAITNNKFHFMPYLGHAYCPAQLTYPRMLQGKKTQDLEDAITDCTVLDETETYNENFVVTLENAKDTGTIIVERHLHHFVDKQGLQSRVLKHWIPLNSEYKIEQLQQNRLSEFYEVEQKVYCLY